MARSDRRQELDRQYNLRAAVPEFQSYFDRYDERSAALRHRLGGRARLDLAYGPSARQAVDLYLPEPLPKGGAPVLVFIHGGYWHSQDRRRFGYVAGPLVDDGIAVALLGYDLAPAVDLDQIVGQVQAGIAWLARHGGELGIDPGRLHVSGHSAGGHLTAMMLATPWREHGLAHDLIKGACPISGIFDLDPIQGCYLNDVLALTDDQVRRLSPLSLAPMGRPPVVVMVGGDETPAFRDQSTRYASSLLAKGLQASLVVEPGLDHFAIVDHLGNPESPLVQRLRNLVRDGMV